jgi:hypothetical protein
MKVNLREAQIADAKKRFRYLQSLQSEGTLNPLLEDDPAIRNAELGVPKPYSLLSI